MVARRRQNAGLTGVTDGNPGAVGTPRKRRRRRTAHGGTNASARTAGGGVQARQHAGITIDNFCSMLNGRIVQYASDHGMTPASVLRQLETHGTW